MGKGGYKAYKTDRQQAVITYQKTPHKGPMAENTLNLFLEARQAEENAIINADKVAYYFNKLGVLNNNKMI